MNSYACHCSCHHDGCTKHCMPCCTGCPYCGENVTALAWHVEEDHPEMVKQFMKDYPEFSRMLMPKSLKYRLPPQEPLEIPPEEP